ncbi:MAG: peptide deformylase [Cyanobacteria bacterium P01_A01_bin.3]
MTCLPIAEMGEPILRQVAQPVSVEDIPTPLFQAFLTDLIDTLRDRRGVGIAAPQVFRSIRAIAIECQSNPRYPDIPAIPLQVLINPEILERSPDDCSFIEGCLSVPERRGEVRRPDWIRVAAYNSAGQRLEFVATDFTARILLHEIDHLNGVLFVDRLISSPVEAASVSPIS